MVMFPRGLTGRTILVLLVAVAAVHAGSIMIYERGLDYILIPSHEGNIRERLAASRNVLSKQSDADRPMMATLLSSESFQLTWLPDDPAGAQHATAPGDFRLVSAETEGITRLDDMTALRYRVLVTSHNGHATHATILSITVMVWGVVLIAALLVRGIVAPLRRLAHAADQIGHTVDVASVPEQGPLEVRQVARAFNAMQQRIGRLIADRTEAMAAVSHDLRTPITRLRLRAGFIADPDIQGRIDHDLDEMASMLDSMLAYLRGEDESESPRPTDLPTLFQTLVDGETDLGHHASYEGPAQLTIMARPQLLKRAFSNLISNAVVYGGGARVRLRLEDNRPVVTIDDDGPGIPAEDIDRVFEPFVRLEPSRNRDTGGVGLGLTIALRAVTIEKGSLVLENKPAGGLTARVELPAGVPVNREAIGTPKNGGDHTTPHAQGYLRGKTVTNPRGYANQNP